MDTGTDLYRHEPTKGERLASNASDRAKKNKNSLDMCFLLVEKFFVINTPDTQPVTSICYILTLQGVEKNCYPSGASA